jgi:ABC-type uncharacterized transport system auxiliary subunit
MTFFVNPAVVRRLTAMLLLASLTAGCYTTRPLTTTQPAVGQHVVLQLTDQGSVDMTPLIGAQMTAIEGDVTAAADGQIVLRVTRTEQRNGLDVTWAGEPVAVPRGAIATMRERTLDKRRSWLFGGGIAALAITLAILVGTGVLGGGSGEGDPPPQ